jgi:hypothetical protein
MTRYELRTLFLRRRYGTAWQGCGLSVSRIGWGWHITRITRKGR